MTDSKAALLSRLRSALQVSGDDSARKAVVAARLKSAPNGVIPARGQLPPKQQVELFISMAEKYSATVTRLKSAKDVPAAVSDYLRARNLAPRIRMGADKRLGAMPWSKQKTLAVKTGASDGTDETGVSHAFGAIAETGTLMLTSGPDNPTTLNFLPENLIVIVDAATVKGDLETLLEALRKTYGKGEMPRTVNLVTGPSRSGDIEQKIILGAHGPRALHVIVAG
jgi:L-lactate dehydrogenase complex protein LldG